MTVKKALLVILDGFGIDPSSRKNAIKAAKTPNLDKLFSEHPYTEITAGGEMVGLPKGVNGNSEVGHMNLGAGRAIRQDLVRINEAIENDTLKSQPLLLELIKKVKAGSNRLHLMGLLSDGGVHSHIKHLEALLDIFAKENIEIYLHAFMDGRDTPINNGIKYCKQILKRDDFTFASMQGRSIGMDRDRRWEKIQTAYEMMTKSSPVGPTAIEYLQSQYEKKIYDEFITPALFTEEGQIKSGDALFFFNFRPDRAKEISHAFANKKFKEFPTPVKIDNFLCMTPYFEPEELTLPILFDKEKVPHTLGQYLAEKGRKQFRIAETEKFAHVTYFFSGGEEKPFKGEERKLIPSPREVKTYDEKPEMSAGEVTKELSQALEKDFDFYLVNYANCDMVGHTGNFEAAVKAVEYIDKCVGELMTKCLEEDISMVLTADHGNCDEMIHPDGTPHTAHTGALVPCVLFNSQLKCVNGDYSLKDIAPTICEILNIPPSPVFTGESIFQ